MLSGKKITVSRTTLRVGGESIKITPLALLVGLAVILRIPSLFEPYWYGDEAIYLTLGEAARQGLVWYRDIFDHKPPMIYLLAAIAGSVFWFRLILLAWHAATVVLFWKLAKALFDKNKKAVVLSSSVFTILTALPLLEANIANSEIFMIGPTIAALYIIFSAKRLTYRRAFASGVLFSLATLFKVPAAFDMFALVAFWGITVLWKGSLASKPAKIWQTVKRGIALGAGFLLPILLTTNYYWAAGALREYLQTAWFFNFGYLQGWGVPTVEAAPRAFEVNLAFRTQVLAVLLAGLVIFKKRFDRRTLFASLWLLFALFAMLLSGRPYPHYIIQVVPPTAILLGLLAYGAEKYRFSTVPLLGILLFALVFYKFGYYSVFSYYQNFASFAAGAKTKEEYFRNFDARVPRTYKLAEIITSRTAPADRIFIWGTEPDVYALSRRLPPTRFVTSFHIGDLAAQKEVLHDLQKNKPRYIIVIRAENRQFPGFRKFLEENYVFVETLEGAEIWKSLEPKLIEALGR